MFYITHRDVATDRDKITGPFETYGLAAAWSVFARLHKPVITRPDDPALTPEERAALELLGKRYIEPNW